MLITNGEYRATLAACRCLHATGYHVAVVSGARPVATHWSRACDEPIRLPEPTKDPVAFVEGLVRLVREGSYAVLMPASDGALAAISASRERFEPYVKIGLPSREAVETSLDKLQLVELARLAGLAAPQTLICDGRTEAAAAASELGFPVVLKPARTILDHGDRWTRPKAHVVSSQTELDARLSTYGRPCLVQQRERGMVYSCAGVMTVSGPLALVTSRYHRSWPPSGGEVAYSETVKTPAPLAKGVESILASLRWQGPFELEAIRRPDGSFAAIDFNPRIYGSLAVAVAAGVLYPRCGAIGCSVAARFGWMPDPGCATDGRRATFGIFCCSCAAGSSGRPWKPCELEGRKLANAEVVLTHDD